MVGGIDSIELDELGTGFDYAALGHIHHAQTLEGADGRVHYSGAPIPVSFDETFAHTVSVVEIASHGAIPEIREVEIKSLHPLVNLPSDGFGSWDEVIELVKAFPLDNPAYIRLNVEVDDYLPPDAKAEAVSIPDLACIKLGVQGGVIEEGDGLVAEGVPGSGERHGLEDKRIPSPVRPVIEGIDGKKKRIIQYGIRPLGEVDIPGGVGILVKAGEVFFPHPGKDGYLTGVNSEHFASPGESREGGIQPFGDDDSSAADGVNHKCGTEGCPEPAHLAFVILRAGQEESFCNDADPARANLHYIVIILAPDAVITREHPGEVTMLHLWNVLSEISESITGLTGVPFLNKCSHCAVVLLVQRYGPGLTHFVKEDIFCKDL